METLTLQHQTAHLRRAVETLENIAQGQRQADFDEITSINQTIYSGIQTLLKAKPSDTEEEADLCLSLLMAYSVAVPANACDEECKQNVVARAQILLNNLTNEISKCQLLVYLYALTHQDGHIHKALDIIDRWQASPLDQEQQQILRTLALIEGT